MNLRNSLLPRIHVVNPRPPPAAGRRLLALVLAQHLVVRRVQPRQQLICDPLSLGWQVLVVLTVGVEILSNVALQDARVNLLARPRVCRPFRFIHAILLS
jgi:hypothetical protein